MDSNLITADYREQASGIPKLLAEKGIYMQLSRLDTGDYILNNELVIERKSAVDFIQSLVSGRLFSQCSRMVRSGMQPLILLEGNPYETDHQIDPKALKGALLSVSASWRIPVIYSEDKVDTAELLYMLQQQGTPKGPWIRANGIKSKRIDTQRLRMLQGLPNTGPERASRLLTHFGNIEAIVTASYKNLQKVEGIGKKTAERIRHFISGS